MAIQERGIRKTGGGSTATGVGVQQQAVKPSAAEKLMQSLGVLTNSNKLSPHQQHQVDTASEASYNELEREIRGLPADQQLIKRQEHREAFEGANPNSFIGDLTGQVNPKMQGYDNAISRNAMFETMDGIKALNSGFTEADTEADRLGALTAMYDTQRGRLEGVSPQVADQWSNSSMDAFNNAYSTIKAEAKAIRIEEAVGEEIRLADNELTHIGDYDIIAGSKTLAGFNQLRDDLQVADEGGGTRFDYALGDKVFSSIQYLRKRVKLQNPTVSKDQLNAMVLEKYKWTAEMYNSPEMFEHLMNAKNGSGMSASELNPQYAQDTYQGIAEMVTRKEEALDAKAEQGRKVTGRQLIDNNKLKYMDMHRASKGFSNDPNQPPALAPREIFAEIHKDRQQVRNELEAGTINSGEAIRAYNELDSMEAVFHDTVRDTIVTPQHDSALRRYVIEGGDLTGLAKYKYASNAVKGWASETIEARGSAVSDIKKEIMRSTNKATDRYVQEHVDQLKQASSTGKDFASVAGVAPYDYDRHVAKVKRVYQEAQIQWLEDNDASELTPEVNRQIHEQVRPQVDTIVENMQLGAKEYDSKLVERANELQKVRTEAETQEKVKVEQKVKAESQKVENLQGTARLDKVREGIASVPLDRSNPSIYPMATQLVEQIREFGSGDIEADIRRGLPTVLNEFANAFEDNSDSYDSETKDRIRQAIADLRDPSTGNIRPDAIDMLMSGGFMQESTSMANNSDNSGFARFLEALAK